MSVATWCSACFCAVLCVCFFCTSHFAMVPLNLTCLHCLQHSFFELLFNLYFLTSLGMGIGPFKLENFMRTRPYFRNLWTKIKYHFKCSKGKMSKFVIWLISHFRIYTVQARPPQGIVQWGYYIFTFPFRFIYSTLLDIIRLACMSDEEVSVYL